MPMVTIIQDKKMKININNYFSRRFYPLKR